MATMSFKMVEKTEKLLDRVVGQLQESILEKDMFINGFRLGAQLVFDMLSPYDSEFE